VKSKHTTNVKAKIEKQNKNVISIWVTTNSHSKVRRYWPNEEDADTYAELINDDILSPVTIDIGELRIDANDPKHGLVNFLNANAFIAVG
jgi:hypothetical protein